MNSQVLVVEERVQKFESGPKWCVNLPFVFKVGFCNQKRILSVDFIALLTIALRTFVYPYLSLLANTLAPLQPLNFYLDCCVFQYVEVGISTRIWYPWFSRLSSGIPFMRSYADINNSRKCLLC